MFMGWNLLLGFERKMVKTDQKWSKLTKNGWCDLFITRPEVGVFFYC
jgi:hypothetical protein